MTADHALQDFVERHGRLFLLTGAGCSTGSGLPDYRDAEGQWKRAQPVNFQDYMRQPATRQRYWARSLIGWRHFSTVRPNDTHRALARLEASGRCEVLVTQNVDRLHQSAGSSKVIDLHGRLDVVRCMACGRSMLRNQMQDMLTALNPDWTHLDAARAPDGDANLDGVDFSSFVVPQSPCCEAILKPDVVFFGENVPRARVDAAMDHLARADAMLVVGTSLMVQSGLRFVRAAAAAGIPVAAVNLGRTRADDLMTLKVVRPCAEALAFLL
jgi:NAD-dependent SIR2 family protein deacetylase